MKIAFDIDGVLAETLPKFIDYINYIYLTDFKYEDITDYSVSRSLGIPKEHVRESFDCFYHDLTMSVPATFASYHALEGLKKDGHDIHVITARQPWTEAKTQLWLDTKYGNMYDTLDFIPSKDKAWFCKDHGIDLIVEDNPKTGQECADKGIDALVRKTPYYKPGDYDSWDSMIELYHKIDTR